MIDPNSTNTAKNKNPIEEEDDDQNMYKNLLWKRKIKNTTKLEHRC